MAATAKARSALSGPTPGGRPRAPARLGASARAQTRQPKKEGREPGWGGRGEGEGGGRVGIERASAHGASACTHVYVGHVPAPTHASHPNPCKPCKPTGLSVHALHALTPHRPCVTPALPACLPCPLFTQTMRFEKQHRRSRSLCHSLESRSTAWGRRPPHNSHCTLPS